MAIVIGEAVKDDEVYQYIFYAVKDDVTLDERHIDELSGWDFEELEHGQLVYIPADCDTVTLDRVKVGEIPFILNRFCEISDHPEEAGKLMDKILDLLKEDSDAK